MSQDWTDFEVIEAERPRRIVEEGVGLKGKRRTRGTYTLEQLPDGGTKVSFELAWLEAARAERLLPAANSRLHQAPQRQSDAPPRQTARLRGSRSPRP